MDERDFGKMTFSIKMLIESPHTKNNHDKIGEFFFALILQLNKKWVNYGKILLKVEMILSYEHNVTGRRKWFQRCRQMWMYVSWQSDASHRHWAWINAKTNMNIIFEKKKLLTEIYLKKHKQRFYLNSAKHAPASLSRSPF